MSIDVCVRSGVRSPLAIKLQATIYGGFASLVGLLYISLWQSAMYSGNVSRQRVRSDTPSYCLAHRSHSLRHVSCRSP